MGPESSSAALRPAEVGAPDPPVLLGVDVGGTFTDALLVAGGRLHSAKVPSTRPPAAGVLQAADAVLAAAGCDAPRVRRFVHGMTVATNALLERRGARVVTLTTEGFRDLLAIARQDRDALYTLWPHRPEPLVTRERSLTVRERVGPEGVEVALTVEEVDRVCAEVAALEPEAVAICLLWSFLWPAHEETLAGALSTALPGVPVVRSSELAPVFREYERLSTTVVDAYVTPVTRGYLEALAAECSTRRLRPPEIMQSSGGTAPLTEAARHGAPLLLSGPTGGVVACRLLGRRLGLDALLSFDMGGTSTDCAALTGLAHGTAARGGGSGGALEGDSLGTSVERTVAGLPVRLPMADINTVSAGGGSIAWVDEGGALKVGPRSAGADPGPACYGLGGTEATVTDANVVLGRIAPGAALGGSLLLDPELARAAVARVAEEVGLSVEDAAEGILRISAFTMASALRAVTLSRGIDPRGFTLVGFGGAGGLHACALAEEVGIHRVLLPVRAGVFSALGLVGAPLRADRTLSVAWPPGDVPPAAWKSAWTELETAVTARLAEEADRPVVAALVREVEARYVGQSYELTVTLAPHDPPKRLAERFHALHQERYDYAEADAAVEVIALRSVGLVAPETPLPAEGIPALARLADATVVVQRQAVPCPVLAVVEGPAGLTTTPTTEERGADAAPHHPGSRAATPVAGPALVTAAEFSAFVAPGWVLAVVPGGLSLTRGEGGS